jgi:hypothetical protein
MPRRLEHRCERAGVQTFQLGPKRVDRVSPVGRTMAVLRVCLPRGLVVNRGPVGPVGVV